MQPSLGVAQEAGSLQYCTSHLPLDERSACAAFILYVSERCVVCAHTTFGLKRMTKV